MKRLAPLAAFAVLAAASAARAQDTPEPQALDPFAQAMAAQKVADFARRQHDAQALIVAARMLQEVPIAEKDPKAPVDATPGAFTPEGLLAEATVMAKGDRNLLMEINLAKNGSRGVLSSAFGTGLVRTVHPVNPLAVYAFQITAKGGELLRIGAIGDFETRMAVRLLDAAGKVLCADDNGDSAPVCSIKPKASGPLKVEVVNKSKTPTRAVILSN